jgi:hypothetical protein
VVEKANDSPCGSAALGLGPRIERRTWDSRGMALSGVVAAGVIP